MLNLIRANPLPCHVPPQMDSTPHKTTLSKTSLSVQNHGQRSRAELNEQRPFPAELSPTRLLPRCVAFPFFPFLCVSPGPLRGLSQVYGLAVDARGGFSGGTIASGFNQAEMESSADVGQLMSDKYFLLPPEAK